MAVVLAFALSTALTWPGQPPVIATTSQRPVSIAALPCDSSLQSTSSGFVIDDELVLTVAHAIYDSREFAVRDATGQWHRASVRHMDLERDLAVLRVAGLTATPMIMRPATSGEPVRMFHGAASGTVAGEILRRVRISTEVIGDRSQVSKRSGYELSVDIMGGDSGAAVLDRSGSLVGVIFARSTRNQASWATSTTELDGITSATGAPEWRCDRASETELILAPQAEPTRLQN